MTRCHSCDRPLATQADYDAHPDGCMCPRCVALCWRAWTTECLGQPVDWRARALKAEAERDAARLAIVRVFDAIDQGMLDMVHGEMHREYADGPDYFVPGECQMDDTCECEISEVLRLAQDAVPDLSAAVDAYRRSHI